MASLTTSSNELALLVKEYRGYTRGNDDDWIKHCATEIITFGQAKAFIEALPIGCTKRLKGLTWLAYDHSGIDDLAWAKIALAVTRRVCCSCHEIGSYRKSGKGA